MIKRVGVLGFILLAVVVVQVHADGLKPVSCDPDLGIFPPLMANVSMAETPPPGSGTLTSRAKTGKGAVRGTKLSISAALDYTGRGASRPDLLYLDFTGEGKFDRKYAIPLKEIPPPAKEVRWAADFGPAALEVRRDGRSYLVTVRGIAGGMATRTKQGDIAAFTLSAVVEGKCTFGKKEYPVRCLDNTGDFRFDERGKFDPKDRRGQGFSTGDQLLIDTGDGTFTRSVIRAYYGQPVFVDGAWYEMTVSADGDKVSARPVKLRSGEVAIDSGKWDLVLERDGEVICVSGGKRPVPAPAGRYNLLYYRQWSAPDAEGKRAWLLATITDFMSGKGKGRTVTVAADKTTKLDFAPPLKGQLSAKVSGDRTVEFSLDKIALQGDLPVVLMTTPGGWYGSHPDAPKVKVSDARGDVVGEFTLDYG